QKCAAKARPISRDQRIATHPDGRVQILGYRPVAPRLAETDQFARVVAERLGGRSGVVGHSAREGAAARPPPRGQPTLEAVLPRAYPLLERPRFDEMAQHDAASGDVALLVSRAACEDAPGRGLVHLVGLVEMRLVSGQEMGLQHP